jgi:hypothetical protein
MTLASSNHTLGAAYIVKRNIVLQSTAGQECEVPKGVKKKHQPMTLLATTMVQTSDLLVEWRFPQVIETSVVL